MGPVLVLAGNGLRRRWPALAGLALVIALGVGAAMASLAIAWRTDHAYPDHLRRAAVGELVVNPSLVTDRVEDLIASTPGVLDVVSDAFFTATPDDGAPRTRAEIAGQPTIFRSSADGRYTRRDRPVVHRGRMIRDRGAEAFLSLDTARALRADVGDAIPVAFWQATPSEADLSEVVSPIGRATVKVVGVGVFSDEVLPDDLYPRQRLVLSPDVTAPFDCTAPHPPPDDTLTLEQLAAASFPEGCSRDPAFYSLKVEGGDAGVHGVLAALGARLEEETARLPKVLRDMDFGSR